MGTIIHAIPTLHTCSTHTTITLTSCKLTKLIFCLFRTGEEVQLTQPFPEPPKEPFVFADLDLLQPVIRHLGEQGWSMPKGMERLQIVQVSSETTTTPVLIMPCNNKWESPPSIVVSPQLTSTPTEGATNLTGATSSNALVAIVRHSACVRCAVVRITCHVSYIHHVATFFACTNMRPATVVAFAHCDACVCMCFVGAVQATITTLPTTMQ